METTDFTLRIGVVTLGGARQTAMEEQFAQFRQEGIQLEVTYIDGVQGSSLKKRPNLKEDASRLLEVYLCVSFSYLDF